MKSTPYRPPELPVTGYVDRFSRRPGERIRAHISVRDGGSYRARLVRVISADPNPNGPGVRFEELPQHFDETIEGQRYPIHLGSYMEAPAPAVGEGKYTWSALVRPGLLSGQPRVVFSHEHDARRLTLSLLQSGLRAEVSAASGIVSCDLSCTLYTHRWYRVWVSCDTVSENLIVGLQPVAGSEGRLATQTMNVSGLRLPSEGRFLVAARNAAAPQEHFDGKIEDPALLAGYRESWSDPLVPLSELGPSVLAGWDFSVDIPTQSVTDTGSSKLHGKLKNVPTRAVRGVRWSGKEMRWSQSPQEYGAIHFHSDDLADCEWPVAFEFLVPSELRSGSYAFHLSCASGEDWIPFYVVPPRSGPHARIAFLAPTFTYQAYANSVREYPFLDTYDERFLTRVRDWGAYPFDPQDYQIYGFSTYNNHPDGSGVGFSSRLRPILSMRPGYMILYDERGSGLRHYPADSHILAWLENRGFAFDIVTDEDLDEEGAALLAPYAVVLTGSHPEYHTARTLDALRDYKLAGGHLAYLGGNGFYWRIGRSESMPGMLELRRDESGTRVWAAQPGEYYHATDGAYGGLWRNNGRPPQSLVGVGFSVQGPFDGTHYRRTPESHDPKFAWIFEGIDTEIIGDYGLSGGGAAGFELDRADFKLGTSHGAVVLASSENVPATFYPTMEELLIPSLTVDGQKPETILRADMVYFETPEGGAVFSAGSITFCGSLWRNGFEGPVSRLVENIVRRFSA